MNFFLELRRPHRERFETGPCEADPEGCRRQRPPRLAAPGLSHQAKGDPRAGNKPDSVDHWSLGSC